MTYRTRETILCLFGLFVALAAYVVASSMDFATEQSGTNPAVTSSRPIAPGTPNSPGASFKETNDAQ